MANDCIFCAIAQGQIPCCKIYEDDSVLAYLDIQPFTEGHTLVIPKAHCANLLEADDETLRALVVRVKRIAAHLQMALPCDGVNILQNNGAAAGQTVNHLHFHIVPRRAGAGALTFENHPADGAQLAALAERLRMN